MIPAVVIALLLLSDSGVVVTQGVTLTTDPTFAIGNLDPTLHSALVNEIYDPNFIPGFQVGLENISVSWTAGGGKGILGYGVGPWLTVPHGIPHLAVGPQCCNFREIPRTQQFRRIEWGDYYYVRAGFTSPGVNDENYTTDFTAPAYVGLRSDWDWVVSISLEWSQPVLLSSNDRWAAIGIAATQFVPQAPNKLVYTVVDLWADENSSNTFHQSASGAIPSRSVGPNVVVYHPVQLSGSGNRTIEINLSPYLRDTLSVLGLSGGSEPPVISYIYLNVEGYNFSWNATLYSFFVISDSGSRQSAKLVGQQLPVLVAFTVSTAAIILIASILRRNTNRAGISRSHSVAVGGNSSPQRTSVAFLEDEKGLVPNAVEGKSRR